MRMRITALQIIYILIALAEWVFMESTVVFRGYVAEGWEMPVGLESAKYVAVFGILFAYYIGGSLIYRKKPDGSQPIVLRSRGVIWAFFFYVPYLLYSFAVDIIFLFRENGREEGVIFFAVKLLAFIWLSIELYKMKKERQTEQQKMLSGQDAVKRLFCMCLVGVFILMWLNLVFLNLRGFFLLDIMSFLKLLMIIYIIVWPMYRNYKDKNNTSGM